MFELIVCRLYYATVGLYRHICLKAKTFMALNVTFEEGTAFFPVILFSPTPCQIKGMFEFAQFFFFPTRYPPLRIT